MIRTPVDAVRIVDPLPMVSHPAEALDTGRG
jgi:hypothetical protein